MHFGLVAATEVQVLNAEFIEFICTQMGHALRVNTLPEFRKLFYFASP